MEHMLTSAVDKLKAALAKRQLSTPTFRASGSFQAYIDYGLISCNRDAKPSRSITSFIRNFIHTSHLPHADVFIV